MTVQELIDELQKIEDKKLQIQYEDNEWGYQPITGICKESPHAWNNPNDPENDFYSII